MPKASEVAAELRRIAESLDKEPETIVDRPLLDFHYFSNKEGFLAIARILPRPYVKIYNGSDIEICNGSSHLGNGAVDSPVWFRAVCNRDSVCRIVKPAQEAVYDCEPLLSAEEEAAIA